MAACPKESLVAAWIDRGVARDADDEVHQHVDGCPDCFALLVQVANASLQGSGDEGGGERAMSATLAVSALVGRTPAGRARRDEASRVGEIIGPYRLLARLGQGGMGIVYRAEHQLIGRQTAVKLLRAEHSGDPSFVARLFNEARAAARIHHPGMVEVIDFGFTDDGLAFLVMELLDGESLGTHLGRNGRLPPAMVVDIARQIAVVLDVVHRLDIVHRDLKPDNVFLVPGPAGPIVKVLDFGMAKAFRDDTLQTQSGALLGTPAYMSPEQCRGAGAVDRRADIYSLGCVLFEMACGRRPFVGAGVGDLIAAHLREAPPRPTELGAPVSPALERVILCALAKEPAARFQTMAELAIALDAVGASGPAPLRRWALPALGLGLTTAAVALAIALLRPAATAAPGPVDLQQPDVAVAVAKVRRSIESTPAGATVARADGSILGQAPLVDESARQSGKITYRLTLAGYRDAEVHVDGDGNTTVLVPLVARPQSPPAAAAKRSPDKRPPSPTVGNGVYDPYSQEK